MIITKNNLIINNDNYYVLVHTIEEDILATMYKNNKFLHYTKWNEEEKKLANDQINLAKNVNPIKTIWI